MIGLKGIKTVKDFDVKDKVVFLRLDLNVPMKKGVITDDTRLQESLPTIRYLRQQGAKLVLASHLGRPKAAGDKDYSLEPVGRRLSELLSSEEDLKTERSGVKKTETEVILVEDPRSDVVKSLTLNLRKNQIVLLENLRYDEGETKDSEELAQVIASYSQIYINDAFGASHRAHASIHALPAMMNQKGMGFLIEKEIQMLSQLVDNPKKPYLAVLGGAKVSDKIPVIEKLIDVVDGFVIGGAMAYTFLKAQGHAVGKSLVEVDKLRYAKEMIARMEARNKTLLLPVDHLITKSISDTQTQVTTDISIPDDFLAVDIGPRTIQNFSVALKEAATIFWNGPMGVFETPAFARGTFSVAQAIAESSGLKIVGGGDSAAAAKVSGFADKMTHISTGGGASLEFLQGDRLPGLEVLRPRKTSESVDSSSASHM